MSRAARRKRSPPARSLPPRHEDAVSTAHDHVGRVLRFLASGGMADEDPDVVRELLETAHRMASAVLADSAASADSKRAADEFLAQLSSDTFDRY